MSNIKNKKYIQKVCGIVYRQLIVKENIDIFEMADNTNTYEYIFEFLSKSFGHAYEDTDFLYACAYLNIQKWGDKILKINPEQITIVPKQTFKCHTTHYESARVDEFYTSNNYMDIMVEYDVKNWDIEPEETERDVTDTWDWDYIVTTEKDSNW
jgi:hypothetical protein